MRLNANSGWKQLYHATWRSLHNKISYLTKSLQRHKDLIHTQASLDNYKEFKDFRERLQSDFKRSENVEKNLQQTRVQQWLGAGGAVDTGIRHENAVKERLPGTGKWLFENILFRNWFSLDQCIDPLLWLHGIPGAGINRVDLQSLRLQKIGKTVLASLIIDEARKFPNATTIFFYCKHTDDQRNGFLTVAKSLLSQIFAQQDLLTQYFSEEASKSTEAILSSSATAAELLKIALSSCKTVYMILDGLDEYSRDDRKELISWIQEVVSSLPKTDLGTIRCLFVSQEDGAARKDLFNVSQIKMTPAENKADIEAFCEKWHKKIEEKFGPLEKEHHVKNVVSARAQGTLVNLEYQRLMLTRIKECFFSRGL